MQSPKNVRFSKIQKAPLILKFSMCERFKVTVPGVSARKKMRWESVPLAVTEMSWLKLKVPGQMVMTSPADAPAIAARISCSEHTSTTVPPSCPGPLSGS